MSFSLCLLLLFLVSIGSLVIGYHVGFRTGADRGFDEGYEFALDPQEVTWRLTASGATALDAAREPLAELSLHESRLPGVCFNPLTRMFEQS